MHIDIETYSSVDIRDSGVYPYTESFDFEVMLFAYAFDDEPVQIVDLMQGEELPDRVARALCDPDIRLWAHNAMFERRALAAMGLNLPPERWNCTAILASYCGLPLRLAQVSEALDLAEFGKSSTGKALIRYFCLPCKPTKVNGGRHRNLPHHAPDKWEEFKAYCVQDVVAEREIHRRLQHIKLPRFEREIQILDQRINDRGIGLDLNLARKAVRLDNRYNRELTGELQRITALDNPNSGVQMRSWLSDQFGSKVSSIAKGAIPDLTNEARDKGLTDVVAALDLVTELSKSSTSKYKKMFSRASADGRARGILQHYGASTGRWAGRGIQPQNLPRNYLPDMEAARELLLSGSYGEIKAAHPEVADFLSQLIRTAIVAAPGKTLCVADFSAIEARVLAWLAKEQWRMDVFYGDGKIYEASAHQMFGIPMEEITKDSKWRSLGKVTELACGYQGSTGAMRTMGGERMGLSDAEMKGFVDQWRRASPNIVAFWYELDDLAKRALKRQGKTYHCPTADIAFAYDGTWLICRLPSRRCLYYYQPRFYTNRFGKQAIQYKSINSMAGNKWMYVGTYGGKLTENIVQAVARDMLVHSLFEIERASTNPACRGFPYVLNYAAPSKYSGDFLTCLTVHDEAIAEVPLDRADEHLETMCAIMSEPPPWAEGFPLAAAGFHSPFYMKD